VRRDEIRLAGLADLELKSAGEGGAEGCLCLLLDGADAVAQDCSQFFYQMWPVSRLFQLLDGCDDDIITDALGIDCMHCLGSRRWRRSVFGQS
jgi:hypothetical protein